MLDPMVNLCWANVCDAGPALDHNRADISCLLGTIEVNLSSACSASSLNQGLASRGRRSAASRSRALL